MVAEACNATCNYLDNGRGPLYSKVRFTMILGKNRSTSKALSTPMPYGAGLVLLQDFNATKMREVFRIK